MQKPLYLMLLIPFLLAACSRGQPRLIPETERFAFGEVINGEVLTQDLILRNEGDGRLVVEGVSTSCGCTKATVEPMVIAPGGSAILHVVFDSGAHGPELTGPITRQIFITTNDPDRAELVIEFDSNILPPAGT